MDKYEYIVNTSKDFITLISRDYVYEIVNNSYCEAVGKKRGDVLNRTVADVWGKDRFDEIIKGQDSDHELLDDMRLGRFVQLDPSEVVESEELPFRIAKTRGQVIALNDVVNNALNLERVPN